MFKFFQCQNGLGTLFSRSTEISGIGFDGACVPSPFQFEKSSTESPWGSGRDVGKAFREYIAAALRPTRFKSSGFCSRTSTESFPELTRSAREFSEAKLKNLSSRQSRATTRPDCDASENSTPHAESASALSLFEPNSAQRTADFAGCLAKDFIFISSSARMPASVSAESFTKYSPSAFDCGSLNSIGMWATSAGASFNVCEFSAIFAPFPSNAVHETFAPESLRVSLITVAILDTVEPSK